MTFTCMIIEDEPMARNLLTQYVQKVPYLQLIQAFSNPLKALEALRDQPADLLFLDIQMPEITGITLLKILPKKPLVILTTAYSEYALEGYELDVVDYLLKPITLERFLKAVEKATARLQPVKPVSIPENIITALPAAPDQATPFIFVKDGTRLVKIRIADIQYIEGLKDYVSIYTPEKKIVALQTLKSLESQLPDTLFIRIHHSYIVALEWIDSIHKERVQVGKKFLPVSDTYRKKFREFIGRNQ